MDLNTLLTTISAATVLAIIVAWFILNPILRRFHGASSSVSKAIEANKAKVQVSEPPIDLIRTLKSVLPDDIISVSSGDADSAVKGHWAEQECERIPDCVVRPQTSRDLGPVVAALKKEHSKRQIAKNISTLFAVRAGGHSAVAGAASITGGILIDLSRLNEIHIARDKKSVTVGAGARWSDVSSLLESEGLATVGGRDSHVGVGGLTLGGGLSFFSPQFGFVCSNVIEYEIVLASGELVTASKSVNPGLWQALKGGANNFGIVTRFTLRCFPSSDIWSGYLYLPAFNTGKVLVAFNQAVAKANPTLPTYDKYAAGPIACFSYIQGVPFQIISVNLVYTEPPKLDGNRKSKWPAYWESTAFSSLWRFWSTCKFRTLTNATDEFSSLNPPGRRQAHAATTVKNDLATLRGAHAAYERAISSISHIKGICWTLVMQPLVPEWARKGDPNPLGLDEGEDEPLVIISFTVNWTNPMDDYAAKIETRHAVEEIEAFAAAHGTAHRYRYLNYCDDWQDPLAGYGDANKTFLREVSKKYDPNGLFQTGCTGGFKLWD